MTNQTSNKRNNNRANTHTNNNRRNKRKNNNSSSLFLVMFLCIVSLVGIVAIVFLSKDLMSGDGVNETTIPFTADVKMQNVKWPQGVELKAEQFIANPLELTGITAEFTGNVDINTIGTSKVDIKLKSEDGSTKSVKCDLEIYEDKEAPVISGVMDRHFNVGDNIAYLKGVTALDAIQGDIEVKVDNSKIAFDENGKAIEGSYDVVYTATDLAGNSATATAKFYFEVNGVTDDMIDAKADEVMANIINNDMSLAQKANAIYLYTYENIAYTGHSEKGDYRKEAYNGLTTLQGDCYTYFAVAQLLLSKLDIPTIDVERGLDNNGERHYWLLVDLGTGYYHFDATKRVHWFNGFMATDAQVNEYSTNVVSGFYAFDPTLYPATPTEPFVY